MLSYLLPRRARKKADDADPPSASLALIAAWWLVTPIVIWVFSRVTGNSVFIGRYLSLGLPGTALMATAAAAISIPENRWREASLALGIGVLLVMGQWTVRAPRHDNSDWRSAALAEKHFAIAPDTPVICPSPFIEARSPVWRPDYPLPGFLYAHLPVYPLRGKLYLFPFEGGDGTEYATQLTAATLAQSGRFIIYGGDLNVRFWRDWFARRPQLQGWQNQTEKFGDVWIAVFTRGSFYPHTSCLPLSFTTTAPLAGRPSSPATLNCNVALVCPALSCVCADSVVCVGCIAESSAEAAKTGATTASVDAASATKNPAANSSRRPRLRLPLTCTCSK